MNNYMEQLLQIEKYIKQAFANDVKGLARLDLITALALSQELLTHLHKDMHNLESDAKQPNEVFNCGCMSNIHLKILDIN